MRIKSAKFNNFLSANRLSIWFDGLTLICGQNASGKSTIMDAIAFALTGAPSRGVKLKRDYPMLLSDGTRKGSVEISFDNDLSVMREIPTGKGDERILEGIDELGAMKFVTSMHAFSKLASDERRIFLFKLMGVSAESKWVGEQLLKRGCEAKQINRILPLLRSGFPAAASAAKEAMADARAAWRALTGEVYGSDKADGWMPDGAGQSFDGNAISAMRKKDEAAQAHISDMMQDLGALVSTSEKRTGVLTRIAQLEPVARLYAARKDAHESTVARQKEASQEAEAAEVAKKKAEAELGAVMAGASPENKPYINWPCPECATKLRYDKSLNALVRHIEDKPEEKIDEGPYVAALDQARQAKEAADNEINGWNKNVKETAKVLRESDQAAIQLDELRKVESSDEGEEATKIGALREKIKAAQKKQRALREQLDDLLKDEQTAALLKDRVTKAAVFHAEVEQYGIMHDALSPSGLQKEILSGALGPFNERLNTYCTAAKFEPVKLLDDMRVLVGSHDYTLCSESEQWRADAVISAAIAKLSGVGFVVLDRLDVLDIKSRAGALGWLYGIRADVQGIVMATLKAKPAGAEGMAVVWLGD